MIYIIIGLALIYVITISMGIYFYVMYKKNKALISQIEDSYNERINGIEQKITSQTNDINSELTAQISSGFSELSSPILNKFIEIGSGISGLNEFFKGKTEELLNGFASTNEEIAQLKEQVITLQSNLFSLATYFSKTSLTQEQLNDLSEELQETINPTDIVIDDHNIKEQVQQIIEYSITPKVKSNNKRIEELIDNGEIMIKGMNN